MRLTAVALTLVGAAACGSSEPKHSHRCDCEYLTDMDVPGTVKVVVCAERESRARELAGECGNALGVGQVSECTCTVETDACAGDICEQAAARD